MKRSVFSSLVLLLALTACGPNGGFAVSRTNSNSINSPSNDGDDNDDDNDNDGPRGDAVDLGICSELSLTGVTWPQALEQSERRALALGLNISGSFEGGAGWSNLSNNFDGQGFSFGLLNQNLGQGSLQPLFIKMRDRYNTTFKSIFSKTHYTSLTGMLSDYERATLTVSSLEFKDARLSELDEIDTEVGSLVDTELVSTFEDQVKTYSAISESIEWAIDTLYTDNGKTFQSTWKAELTKLGSHPDYVSLQIEAAQKIHLKALEYMDTLKMSELRSYLFLFDVVVQNGGLYADDISDYKKYFGTTSPTETARLNKILELRLRKVKSEYKTDVQSRKSALINGVGKVHGSNRNLEKEYCFTGKSAIKSADANFLPNDLP